MRTGSRYPKLALVATTAILLSACESSGSYRLASVGNVPAGGDTASSSGGGEGSSSSSSGGGSSGGTSSGGSSGGGSSSGGTSSGGTASSGGSSSSGGFNLPGGGKNIIVTAGNTVIGVAGQQQKVVTVVDGVVTKILIKTGQTLVKIGNGNTLILGGTGGKIGDLIRIDIGSKTVIGAPNGSPLLGVGVLAPAGSGNLVTATLGKTFQTTISATQPLTNVLATPSGSSATNGLVPTVTGVANKVTGIVTPATTPSTGQPAATGGLVGGVVTTTTGVVGGVLKPKK